MRSGKKERDRKNYPLSGTNGANWDHKNESFSHMAPTKGVHDCDLPEMGPVSKPVPNKGY